MMKKTGIVALAVLALLIFSGQWYGNASRGDVRQEAADDLAIDLRTESPAAAVKSYLAAVGSGSDDKARALTSLAPPGFRQNCEPGGNGAKSAVETAFERELDRKLYDLLGSTAEYLRISRPEIGAVSIERINGPEAVVSVTAAIAGNPRSITFYLTGRGTGWAIFHIDAVPVNEPTSASFGAPRPPCPSR